MIIDRRVETLVEFAQALEDVSPAPVGLRWFRGVGSELYPLLPGLFRNPTGLTQAELFEVEETLYTQFELRSPPFLDNRPADGWERLFLMQHHRMPTRLLDWTESPFVALYFALEAAERDHYSHSAVVWALDPIAWNEHTFRSSTPTREVLTTNSPKVRPYASPPDLDLLRDPPVAIFAPHNSARIVAQSGTFTVFGKSIEPMEVLLARDGYPPGCLSRIIIPTTAGPSLLQRIVSLGYTHSKVYPDLDGLAAELRRMTGFAS